MSLNFTKFAGFFAIHEIKTISLKYKNENCRRHDLQYFQFGFLCRDSDGTKSTSVPIKWFGSRQQLSQPAVAVITTTMQYNHHSQHLTNNQPTKPNAHRTQPKHRDCHMFFFLSHVFFCQMFFFYHMLFSVRCIFLSDVFFLSQVFFLKHVFSLSYVLFLFFFSFFHRLYMAIKAPISGCCGLFLTVISA